MVWFFSASMIFLLVIFTVIVAPIWLWLHYRKGTSGTLSGEERELLHELTRQAKNMQERIHSLEAILDAERPDWREEL